MPLKDIKYIKPIEISDYTVSKYIDHKTAFAWWVPFTLKKWNRIVSKPQNKYWRMTYKFGIEVPTLMKQAYGIDYKTGN